MLPTKILGDIYFLTELLAIYRCLMGSTPWAEKFKTVQYKFIA